MDGNSSKPAETQNPRVYAAQVALAWLEQEGGKRRVPSALREVLLSTVTALQRGDPPPEKDSMTLAELWRLSRGGDKDAPATPIRGVEVERWWESRESHLRQVCCDKGCQYIPALKVVMGGGRNVPTQFSFTFLPLDPGEPDSSRSEISPAAASADATSVAYRIDPVKPALWMRLLVGSRPFPMQSWRGFVLLGSTLIHFALIALIWFAIYASWSSRRPITTADLATAALALVITGGLWALTKPVRQLPEHRVTLAGVTFVALSELHGQLRTMPKEGRKGSGRVFSLVRHWGVCPVCSGDVDLDWGGAAFPDRLIGRCSDAPLEHVFSFDPVRLVGEPLRQSAPADAG